MVISHFGGGMVKIGQGDKIAVFNPIGESASFKPVRFGADLALVSLADPLYNGVGNVARGDRVPFAITGPGEYEIGGIFIKGYAAGGSDGRSNTVYSLILEGINLVHLGALAAEDLPPAVVEELGVIDILFVPAGNEKLISAKAAGKLTTKLSPRVIVPVDYDSEESLTKFLKEMGEEKAPRSESLQVKRKDLLDKEGEVMVIKSF
jgi:L-ascorbate metabolism protein UlaG (beta-lactamase superfamily)